MKWATRFWYEHGDRTVFMAGATAFALAFYFFMPDMKGEAKTILIGVAMLLFNKARSGASEEPPPEKPPTQA